jgi:integrase/recombinase XerD
MFDSPVVGGGPLGLLAEGFEAELRRLGYGPATTSRQLGLLDDLSRWMSDQGIAPDELTSERLADFVEARRRNGRARYVSQRGMATLLGYLRTAGGVVPPPARRVPASPTEVVLERYWRFLVEERGLADAVVAQYETGARMFAGFAVERGLGLAEVSAAEVSSFVTDHCANPVKFAPPELATILRGFLRFLYVEGVIGLPLSQAVPPVASWSGSRLPKALPPGASARLLRSCDRRTAHGRRDYAILMLLVRLGLRAGEIGALGLDDFDWRAGELVIHGKGRLDERLPLPADVGESVVGYLRRGRPRTDCRALFVRMAAPLVGLSRASVTYAVYTACDRAGLPRASAHRLRHTLATELLRSGSSLAGVGQVLRHRSISATAIYAKVDHQALAGLARPWPGGAA